MYLQQSSTQATKLFQCDMCLQQFTQKTNLIKQAVSAHGEELTCNGLWFECPKCEAVRYWMMTELISHSNEYHKDIDFGLWSINVSIIHYTNIPTYIGIQHHEFHNAEEF